jgi:hypothetical protein
MAVSKVNKRKQEQADQMDAIGAKKVASLLFAVKGSLVEIVRNYLPNQKAPKVLEAFKTAVYNLAAATDLATGPEHMLIMQGIIMAGFNSDRNDDDTRTVFDLPTKITQPYMLGAQGISILTATFAMVKDNLKRKLAEAKQQDQPSTPKAKTPKRKDFANMESDEEIEEVESQAAKEARRLQARLEEEIRIRILNGLANPDGSSAVLTTKDLSTNKSVQEYAKALLAGESPTSVPDLRASGLTPYACDLKYERNPEEFGQPYMVYEKNGPVMRQGLKKPSLEEYRLLLVDQINAVRMIPEVAHRSLQMYHAFENLSGQFPWSSVFDFFQDVARQEKAVPPVTYTRAVDYVPAFWAWCAKHGKAMSFWTSTTGKNSKKEETRDDDGERVTKKKGVCIFFQSDSCNKAEHRCQFQHKCKNCSSATHGADECHKPAREHDAFPKDWGKGGGGGGGGGGGDKDTRKSLWKKKEKEAK